MVFSAQKDVYLRHGSLKVGLCKDRICPIVRKISERINEATAPEKTKKRKGRNQCR